MRIVRTAAAAVLLSGLGAATGGAVVPLGCDLDKDNYINGSEARRCTEQRFEQISSGQKGFGPEQLGKALPDVQNPGALFKEIDQDGDGQISRQEWSEWQEQSFSTATAKSGSLMPAANYQKWVEGAYTRPTTTGQNSQ